MRQNYSSYTREDFQVWETLFIRQMEALKGRVCKNYLEGMKLLDFRYNHIPDFRKVNPILRKATGWELEVVPGIVPSKDFFEMLAEKRFPATTWLRKMSQLDYIEEPDMFHDVFGHVPLLANMEFSNFLKGISDIALRHIDDEFAVEMMSRVYWWTVEFGLIREDHEMKIYGAGLMSSIGEAKHSLSGKPAKNAFEIPMLLQSGYVIDSFQPKYFVIASFEQLYHSLPELSVQLDNRIEVADLTWDKSKLTE